MKLDFRHLLTEGNKELYYMKKCIMHNKKRIVGYTIILIIIIIGIWIVWGNVTVGMTVIEIHDTSIPNSFEGYKIAQISDLHNAVFGEDNSIIIEMLKESRPDIITLTGDLVDSNHTNMDIAVSFARQAVEIAPCYYVTGNHEAWLGKEYNKLENLLNECGVIILHNQTVQLYRNGENIQLVGIDDPDFAESGNGMFDISAEIISSEIGKADFAEGYKILLSHRPEIFDTYVENDINLVLCGHAHGGQFRLPFIGGIVAPNQGLFPRYDSGIYKAENTTMVVSRGIGNSIIPVRFNNRAEIVLVVLYR